MTTQRKGKQTKSLKVELDWKWLQQIAEYYEFPSAVFLGGPELLRNKQITRNQLIQERLEAYERIKDIIEEDSP